MYGNERLHEHRAGGGRARSASPEPRHTGYHQNHSNGHDRIRKVLNDCMSIVREGGAIGIPGLYVTEDPGAVDAASQHGDRKSTR